MNFEIARVSSLCSI